MTAGWHEDANGKWYQNTDDGIFFKWISGYRWCYLFFDENDIQTGWVEKGVKDYYFNEDGSMIRVRYVRCWH